MKAAWTSSLLFATSLAAVERSWVEGVGQNGTSGQFVRVNSSTAVDMLGTNGSTSAAVKWTVTASGVYYEDSGEEKLRIEHNLTANIFATDTILFELAFRPNSLSPPTDTASIGEDYVQCEMTQNSSDPFFWSAAVQEGYYICKDGFTDATNVCVGVGMSNDETTNYSQQTDSTQDWVTPFVDEDPKNPWCTHANTTAGATLNPYECTALKCVIERKLDTGDTDNDLVFTVNGTTSDKMVIQPGRAKLYFNKSTAQFAYAARNDFSASALEITILNGASTFIAASAAALSGFALLAF